MVPDSLMRRSALGVKSMHERNWSQPEIDAAVRQYLRMKDLEDRQESFSKAQINRLLRTAELRHRSKGSIEYRMCNISAVMHNLGLPIVHGYKPRWNVGSGVESMIRKAVASRRTILDDVQMAREIMSSIFDRQHRLRELAPEYGWRGLGNLLGDYGEFVCTRFYSLRKASVGATGYDAWNAVGDTVQIKTNRSSETIGFRGEAELLLAIQVDDRASWSEIYYGDFQEVKRIARYSRRDNKFTVTREALCALGSEILNNA